MKNIRLLTILLTSLFLWYSCDKVEPPYVENGNGGELNSDTVRKVLVEDFTGHTCVNCPQAHKIIEDLQQHYGKQLVAVAIHAGFFAKPKSAPYDYDFRTTEGTALYNLFQVQATPIGMVNRVKQSDGGYLVNKGALASEVSKQLDSLPQKPDLYIHLTPSFNSSDSTLSLAAEITFLEALPSAKYNLCIMVTESDIVKAQKNNDPTIGSTPDIFDYHHKHVLRGMMTPTLGEEILDGTPGNMQVISKSYSNFKFGADWVPKNCRVVAFVYYADGPKKYQIIQAQEVEVATP